jgi:hypothetical protein
MMLRECAHCHRPLTPEDLAREESKEMEAERRKYGLEGVRFLYYRCAGCDHADIFMDVLPLEGETDEAFRQRRAALEEVARQMHGDGVEVVVKAKPPQSPPEGDVPAPGPGPS